MDNAQLINQTSGNVEIYTPKRIVDAAREAMGGTIELDPASSAEANAIVRAKFYFTKEDDGLSRRWYCETLWMNHPFSREGNVKWINKLLESFKRGQVRTACCITFASTSEEWFRPLLDYPQCYLWPRTNYMRPDGTAYRGVTKGSVVTYFGPDVWRFKEAFKGLGTVKI